MRKFLVYSCFHNDQSAVVYPEERRGWGWGDSNICLLERGMDPPNNITPVMLQSAWLKNDRQRIITSRTLDLFLDQLSCQDFTCPEPQRLRPCNDAGLDEYSIIPSWYTYMYMYNFFSSCIANFKINKGNFQYDYLMPHFELPSFVYDAKQD